MALIELDYEERADGLLYPIIDMGIDGLDDLGKFGKARLAYLHSAKFEFYRELLFAGELTEHCEKVEIRADKLHNELFQKYLEKYPPPSGEDFFERTSAFYQADNYANEIVLSE